MSGAARMADELVSVVIPTAGRSTLVARACRSVLAQSYATLELIVVIDGPDPATAQALAEISDARLQVVTLDPRGGGGVARNHGVALARGAWIAFLDDDDTWLPGKLAAQTAAASPDQDVLVTCLSHVISPNGTEIWPLRIHDNRSPIGDYLFCRRRLGQGEGHLQTSTYLVPRRLMLQVPFRNLPRHQDWDFILHLFAAAPVRLLTVAEPLVNHYIDEPRTSVGRSGNWRESVAWLDSVRTLVSRQAYSGFCTTIAAHRVASPGTSLDWVALLMRTVRHGRLAPRQAAMFFIIVFLPQTLRKRMRTILVGKPGLQTAA